MRILINMSKNTTLFEQLNSYKSIKEGKIRDIYNNEFEKHLNTKVNIEVDGGYADDGYINIDNDICCLLEYKQNKNFKNNKRDRSVVIIQCMCYLQKIKELGKRKPSSIFIGDKNECFIIDAKYLYENYLTNYSIVGSPSTAHMDMSNVHILEKLDFDENLDIYKLDYFKIDEKFKFIDIIKSLRNIQDETFSREVITKHNITEIYKNFTTDVLIQSKRKSKNENKLTINESVNLFIQILINPKSFSVDVMNVLTGPNFQNKEIKVSSSFETFFDKYKLEEDLDKKELTSYADRIIEDETRRRKGEFYTPSIWTDEAHKEISKHLGDDWKERYIVWDCCAGTFNLTRDYKFKDLYCSTLEQSDIDTANKMNYNPEATKFQFDFLNDDDDKLPRSLRKAIDDGKEILFFINPPYATGGEKGVTVGKQKRDISNTNINQKMLNDGWGKSVDQLYAQFLYKIYNINKNNNIKICNFSSPRYKTGTQFIEFRSKFLNKFKMIYSMMFCANHFSETSSSWGIDFSIWISEKTYNINEFNTEIKDFNKKDLKIETKSNKSIYNLDNLNRSGLWLKLEFDKIDRKSNTDYPNLKSAITIANTQNKMINNSLGYFPYYGNSIDYNSTNIMILSSPFSNGHGISILPKNFHKVTTLFTARKSIKSDWINCKDEYMAPNEIHPEWQQFVNDSIVYSLFNDSSQQSSLRQVDYKDKLWNIKNEFFWLSYNQMKDLADQYNFKDMLSDIQIHNTERFVYEKLKTTILSKDAQAVLDSATNLVIKSIEKRKEEHYLHEEYYLDSWDAGYAQLKLVWDKHYKEEFNAFRDEYKKFEQRLIPLVYDLGFLRK